MSVTPGAATTLLGQVGQAQGQQGQQAQPAQQGQQGQQDALIAVPQSFLNGLLGMIGGKVGEHFGGSTGAGIGQFLGQTVESILPFQVLPQGAQGGQYQPASAGPQAQVGQQQGQQGQQEALIAVPQSFLNGLLGVIGGKVGQHFGGSTGAGIGQFLGQTVESILPFQVLPTTGPGPRAYPNGYAATR
jgi:hypothetical protein